MIWHQTHVLIYMCVYVVARNWNQCLKTSFNLTFLISWKYFSQSDVLSALINTTFFTSWPLTLLPLSMTRSKIKPLVSSSAVHGLYNALSKQTSIHPLQSSLTALLFFSCTDSSQITIKLALVAPTGHHHAFPFKTQKRAVHCDVALRSVTLISYASTQEQSFTKFIYYATCLG